MMARGTSDRRPQRKVAQDTIIVFALFLAAAFFAYLFRILLARTLSLKDYGLFFAVVAFLGIINIFRDLGIGQSTMYYVPRFIAKRQDSRLREFISKILKVELLTSVISMLLIIAIADFLAQNYFHYGASFTIMLFAVAYLFNSMELSIQVLFNAFQSQKIYALHNLARAALVLILASAASLTSYRSEVNTYVYMQLVAYIIIAAVFGSIFFRKLYPKKVPESRTRSKIRMREVFMFGLIATGAQLCYFFITTTDTVFLTYMTTLEDVGLYNAVIPIVTLLLYFTMALGTVITPRVSELAVQKKFADIRFLWDKSIKYVLIATLPFIGLLVMYPQLILQFMFGEKFVSASTALIILGSGIIFFGLSQINMSFLLSIIGPKKNLVLYAIATVVNIILNAMLIPKYGIVGAAAATIISYGILFLLSTATLLRTVSLRARFSQYALIILSALIYILFVSVLKYYLALPVLLELAIVFVLSGLLYVALLFALRIIDFKELRELQDAVMR